MYEGKEKIEEWKKEIEKIKKKIDEKRFQIEGGLINKRVNKIDGEIDGEKVIGWREKMMEGYSEIGYLSKDLYIFHLFEYPSLKRFVNLIMVRKIYFDYLHLQ